jgi:hypothetical protein
MIATPCHSTLTAKGLARLWHRHVYPTTGCPDSIVSDGDPLFMATAWKEYIRDYLGATPLVTTPAHAQGDGQSERAVQTLRDLLRSTQVDAGAVGDWTLHLANVVFAYNNSIHDVTKQTPFFLAMMRHPRTTTSIGSTATHDELRELVGPLRADVQDRITRAGARAAKYHDRHRRAAPDLLPGDLVFVAGRRMGSNAPARLAELGSTATVTQENTAKMGRAVPCAPRRLSENVYAVSFPSGIRVSSRVNVKDIKVATGLDDCPAPPPVHVDSDGTLWAVESILDARETNNGKTYVLVRWTGLNDPKAKTRGSPSRTYATFGLHLLLESHFGKDNIPNKQMINFPFSSLDTRRWFLSFQKEFFFPFPKSGEPPPTFAGFSRREEFFPVKLVVFRTCLLITPFTTSRPRGAGGSVTHPFPPIPHYLLLLQPPRPTSGTLSYTRPSRIPWLLYTTLTSSVTC